MTVFRDTTFLAAGPQVNAVVELNRYAVEGAEVNRFWQGGQREPTHATAGTIARGVTAMCQCLAMIPVTGSGPG